ncbi:MAG: DNA-directed RNA polymerase subunit delta [Erysipelotrichaceae bacterium]|nr:DNA-directed RNA polymerase subunit delta [Erysipelotrichaceae bacterium]
MQGSMLELAHEFLDSKPKSVTFKQIWAYVVKQKGFSEEEANKKVSSFYTSLLLDGRFVTLGENKWDLRSRHTFDKVHIDMKDVYSDMDTSDSDSEEVEEEEYNKTFAEPVEEERSDFGQDEEDEDDSSKEEEALNS